MPRFDPKDVPKFEKPPVAGAVVVFEPNNPPDRNDDGAELDVLTVV